MKPIKVIQFAWVGEVFILIVVAIILIFGIPERVQAYVSMLPILAGLIAGQGGCAFTGPILKRKQLMTVNQIMTVNQKPVDISGGGEHGKG